MKLREEEKQEIARLAIECRVSTRKLCIKYGLNKETVNLLKAKAALHGYESLKKGWKINAYTREFKMQVIKDLIESQDSGRGIANKYGLNKITVRKWYAEYKEKGDNAFMEEKRGRVQEGGRPKGKMPKIKENKKREAEESELEWQLKETQRKLKESERQNRYLLLENEYLKKLDALVRERIEREEGKKSR